MARRRKTRRGPVGGFEVAYRRALLLAGVDVGMRCACGGSLAWQPVAVMVELAWEMGANVGGMLVLAEDAVAHGGDDSSPTSFCARCGAVSLLCWSDDGQECGAGCRTLRVEGWVPARP